MCDDLLQGPTTVITLSGALLPACLSSESVVYSPAQNNEVNLFLIYSKAQPLSLLVLGVQLENTNMMWYSHVLFWVLCHKLLVNGIHTQFYLSRNVSRVLIWFDSENGACILMDQVFLLIWSFEEEKKEIALLFPSFLIFSSTHCSPFSNLGVVVETMTTSTRQTNPTKTWWFMDSFGQFAKKHSYIHVFIVSSLKQKQGVG